MSNNLGQTNSIVDQIIAALGNTVDYAHQNRSFSPFYSDIGLGFTEESGIARLFLHYNRRTTAIGSPFLELPHPLVRSENTAISVCQSFEHGTAEYAFYGRNSWLIECKGLSTIKFHFADPYLTEARKTQIDESGYHIFDGYLPTKDSRDPDPMFPIVVGLRVICGQHLGGDGVAAPMLIEPDPGGRLVVSFTVNILDVVHSRIQDQLGSAPASIKEARTLSRMWLGQALGSLAYHAKDPAEVAVLAKGAYTLAFNACEAPGLLAGRIAAFPSRGGYPTHFLWDSCFQNLALEHMDPRLAADSLLLLTENLRPDGKMAHFICSTWVRPLASQPPLVGWAALRLVQQRHDKALARKLLPSLLNNTQWWLTQRMTRYQIICCPDPLETGWDDTPRLDRGPILACDMNSFLVLQMRACAELARLIGDDYTAAECQAQADSFAARMADLLYDAGENLFKDVLLKTGEQLAIKTPACFLPLLAGVPIGEHRARTMIEHYLLNPKRFFGPVPFPCVAYDEAAYDPEHWWRGPTWPPVAYLMLEVLKKYGYTAEYRQAAQRLYTVIINDGNISELFNSQTGKGMGCNQQGWTAAIVLRLNLELQELGKIQRYDEGCEARC